MGSEPGVGLVRRLQLWAIARLRRSRFLPVGIPDKQTDQHRLGRAFRQEILVYFPTGQDSLYQLRPWYHALAELDAAHSVVVVFKDSRTAAVVASESSLDCVTLANYGQLDAILAASDVKLALYVNQDPINFECLRFTSLVHAYLGHGDSEKTVFVSNQIKAYDYYFVAGQSAVDRVAGQVMLYDAAERCLQIGQPQLDAVSLPAVPPARPTVLYAPTWEGAQPSVAYGSLVSHGQALVESILADGDLDLIYRPHPFTGNIDPTFSAADAAIRARVTAAGQRVDVKGTLGAAIAHASILITDISAVTSFWLPTGRPLIVTEPADAKARATPEGISSKLPRLASANAGNAAAIVKQLLANPPDYSGFVEHHLGDVRPGAATKRFIAACSLVIAERDDAWAALRKHGATGP
ncbi:MAG: CDP-glycerol glycerophosphotransferase family protein [Aeromicrobium sp.]